MSFPSHFPLTLALTKIFLRTNSFSKVLGYHLETLFLFTKSDLKTTLVPVAIFALGTTPLPSKPLKNSLTAIFWLWLVLLQFNLINQTILPEEDAKNKPWRPIPSGRISLDNAITLRWISIPLCWLISSYFGTATLISCISFSFLSSIYHFYDGDKNGIIKNLLNGFGYYALVLGTTLVASRDANWTKSLSQTLHWKNFPEFTIFFFVLVTTIQAQDFQDVDGDRLVGRNTLPMMFPSGSRVSMVIVLPSWSVFSVYLSDPPASLAIIFLGLSMVVGFRFFLMRRVRDDKLSYALYNLWLSLIIVHMCLYKRQLPQATSWAMKPSISISNSLMISNQSYH